MTGPSIELQWEFVERPYTPEELFEMKMRKVGLLTYCINSLDMTDKERMMLREMLRHTEADTLNMWGMMNQTLAQEVFDLFEKLKVQINA